MQLQKLRSRETSTNRNRNSTITSSESPLIGIQSHFSGFLQQISDSVHRKPLSLPSFPQNPSSLKTHLDNTILTIGNHAKQAFQMGFLQQISDSVHRKSLTLPSFPQNPSSLKTHLDNTILTIGNHAKQAFQMGFSRLNSPSQSLSTSARNPNLARAYPLPRHQAMPTEAIEERLAGIPVYALSNSAEEFVLLSGVRTGKSLGLFCFKREDAEALLEQMKAMDPGMRRGSKVVAVALNKVFQLKVDGVAFRFIPESSQIMNALKEKEKVGDSAKDISGIPVFQSRSLILSSQNKRYRPVFFRKEDLDKSLLKASKEQNQLNPAFRRGDIQVCVLEEMIKGMQESSSSMWDDVVFIPPGFDISANASE